MINYITISFIQTHLLIKYTNIKIKSHFKFNYLIHFFLLTLIYYLHYIPSYLSKIIIKTTPITIKS